MTIFEECNPGETGTIPSYVSDIKTIQTYRCCEGDRCNDPKLMPIPNRTPKPKSSSNKLTSQNVLIFSILLGFVHIAAGWLFN